MKDSYEWEPTTVVEFMAFPCLAGIAEIGWSPEPDGPGATTATVWLPKVKAAEIRNLGDDQLR